VYRIASNYGPYQGLKALLFRYENCRSGFGIFRNPVTHEHQLISSNGIIFNEEEIAKRILLKIKLK
jgi:hypothetical protein